MVEKISILTGLYTKKGTLKSVSFFVGSPSISMFRGGKAAVFFAVPPSGLVLSLQCGCNESLKKRMRAVGTALELGVELSDRPFYVGVQYHPEFKSRPNRPHPLFQGFIAAALEGQN